LAAKAFAAAKKLIVLAWNAKKLYFLEGFGGRKAAKYLIQRAGCGAHERHQINSAAMDWRSMYCANSLQTM
jgi:hypothetical protein